MPNLDPVVQMTQILEPEPDLTIIR